MKHIAFGSILAAVLFLIHAQTVFGQAKCLSDEEAKKAVEKTEASENIAENPALRQELLDMLAARQELEQKIAGNWEKNQNLIPQANELSRKNLLR
ncbi:MAG: hypothetical protein ACR2GD_08635, partial [Pyrinomonadaceae bacterium]